MQNRSQRSAKVEREIYGLQSIIPCNSHNSPRASLRHHDRNVVNQPHGTEQFHGRVLRELLGVI